MAVSVVSSTFSRAAQPEAQGPLCWVLAFFTASYQYLLWTPIHLGPKPFRADVAFPTTPPPSPSPTVCNSTGTWLPSWLRYIIIQRPHDRPLDLWNRMFNRHQAEITVMQFRGHSLPVRQSMRVSWDFFSSSHFVSQFPPTRFPLLTAIGMCHCLLVHHLEWHFGPGRGSKYNTRTWHKVDLLWTLRAVGHEPKLELCRTMLVFGSLCNVSSVSQ